MVHLKTILDRITAARISVDMSTAQLGDAIGVTDRQVRRYEDGSRKITIETMLKIAVALNKELSWFFNENDKKETSSQGCPSFTHEESHILDIYRQLNEDGKRFILDCVNNASEVGRYRQS